MSLFQNIKKMSRSVILRNRNVSDESCI